MGTNQYLGEVEQMVLLAVLQPGEDANALEIRRELERMVYLLIALTLGTAGFTACILPTRAATRDDPSEALPVT